MNIKTYSELIKLPTFSERVLYTSMVKGVGEETFAGRRVLNQAFYRSAEWKKVRDTVIVRDLGCDLAHQDFPIIGKIIVHHLNPITINDLSDASLILDPELLVCVSLDTHNVIHYGDVSGEDRIYTPRSQNDTCPWR